MSSDENVRANVNVKSNTVAQEKDLASPNLKEKESRKDSSKAVIVGEISEKEKEKESPKAKNTKQTLQL